MRALFLAAVGFFLALVSVPASAQQQQQNNSQSLADLLQSQSNLTNFTQLLSSYGDINQNLSASKKPITIFAPSNDAFAKLPYQVLGPAFDTNNTDVIKQLLLYHVADGMHLTESFTGSFQFLPTYLTDHNYSNVTGGQVVACVQQAGQVFVAVSGLGSRSTLTTIDLPFQNGILHIVDTFLIPPLPFITSAPTFNLTSLPAAFLTLANDTLNTILATSTSLTIFAPSNAALFALGATLSTLSPASLNALLAYHIVPSNKSRYGTAEAFYSSNLPSGPPLPGQNSTGSNSSSTLVALGPLGAMPDSSPPDLTVTFASNSIFVNQARIQQQDLLLSNGVMHIIDSVLDPNITTVVPQPTLATQVQVIFGTPLSDGGLPFTTALPTTTTGTLFAATSTSITSGEVVVVTTTDGSGAVTLMTTTVGVGPGGGSSYVSSSTATGSAMGALTTGKSQGNRVGRGGVEALVLGAMVWVLGFL